MKKAVSESTWELDLGANWRKGATEFTVWAPLHVSLSVKIEGKGLFPLQKDTRGFFTGLIEEALPGDVYFYQLENGLLRPDPVSRSLPKGIYGPTEILDPERFSWSDDEWSGINLRESIFYELHVGTFTKEGTFEGIIEKLPYLKELGITCIEIMPITAFPGKWNWGYDGVSPYAPSPIYGGTNSFKQLVNACHAHEIAVCLDVVYNHLGPEGNYLREFGPYFSGKYHTPWGQAFNYDGAYSDQVRDYIIKNALYWITEYHVDCLRLDAIHGIYDFSASTMIAELIEAVQKLERRVPVIAESDLNDARVLRPKKRGGWELSALWNDDFHHAMHVALTGEKHLYYRDFEGLADVATSLTQGFVYDGKYSTVRKRRHGNSSTDIPFEQFLVFAQNHDQVGNRPFGERLSRLINKRRLKVAAVMELMTPFIPLLFMGEEYGETVPFEYFVDYEEESLMRRVYEGRKREFHREDMPFPGKQTYLNSHLTWAFSPDIRKLYLDLIALRKEHLPREGIMGEEGIHVYHSPEEEWIAWEYETENGDWIGIVCYLGKENYTLTLPFQEVKKETLLLATEEATLQEDTLTLPAETACIIISGS